ncbi:hypothetical protein GW796_07630 [archaeon]|nr:hypothetical protein [archaeon]
MKTLLDCVGKKIETIDVSETSLEDGSVHTCIFHFTDGTKLEISPTSFNYGPQNLVFSD